MNAEELNIWQRCEPDLYELIDGEPVRLADEKQITRRIFRVLAVATNAYGSIKAGQSWLELKNSELRAIPADLAAEGWEGVVRCLRFLAAASPGCTQYTPIEAPFRLGPARDLLDEAERYAAIVRHRDP
jgi:phosphoribosyl-dephospho-CoA transferase